MSINKQIGVGGIVISKKEKKYLRKVINSNRLSYGPFMQKFERDFAKEHQCKYGIMCNSGTSALRVAIEALKEYDQWKPGDEVLVPSVTFVASSNVIIQQGLKPIFVDVEKEYYGINPELIEKSITKKTKAIMVVHLFGMPCNMEKIMSIAKKHNLRVIEDSCETMFSTFQEQKVGSFGDISCFSTYSAHMIATGVGGIALTNNDDLAIILRSLINHGRDNIYISIDDDKVADTEQRKMVIARRFNFVRLGYSFRVTEMEAALAQAQLEDKDEMLQKRRNNAAFLTKALSTHQDSLQLPKIRPESTHSWMMYPIVITDHTIKKTDLVNYLEENMIETRDMLPLINQPVYKKLFGDLESKNPVAAWINENGFYIGCHQFMGKKQLEHIRKTFNQYFKNKKVKE